MSNFDNNVISAYGKLSGSRTQLGRFNHQVQVQKVQQVQRLYLHQQDQLHADLQGRICPLLLAQQAPRVEIFLVMDHF